MSYADHYKWLNPLREMLGLAPIPFTTEAVEPVDEDPSWLADGGCDYSTGDELMVMPPQQAAMFKRRGIRNLSP